MKKFATAELVLTLISALGWLTTGIGGVLLLYLLMDQGIGLALFGGGAIVAGLCQIAVAQIGLAQISTAQDTSEIKELLRIISKSLPSEASTSSQVGGVHRKTTQQRDHGLKPGSLQPGSRVKVYKGYEILKTDKGVAVGAMQFDNVLRAEVWISEQAAQNA